MSQRVKWGCFLFPCFALTALFQVVACPSAHGAVATAQVRQVVEWNSRISAIAFTTANDLYVTQANPSVLLKVDPLAGSLQGTTSLSSSFLHSLTWDEATGVMYTTDPGRTLCTLNLSTGVVSLKPQQMPLFNFWDIEIEPATGNLWAATDLNGGELYLVDKASGAATLTHSLGVFARNGGGIQSMAFGPDGSLFVAGETNPLSGPDLWKVDLLTNDIELVADLPFPTAGMLLTDIDYDRYADRWYAVAEDRIVGRRYFVLELMGIPEPDCSMAAVALLVLRRSRRQDRRFRPPGPCR